MGKRPRHLRIADDVREANAKRQESKPDRATFKNASTWTATVLEELDRHEEQGYIVLPAPVQVFIVPASEGSPVPFYTILDYGTDDEGHRNKVCDIACRGFRYRNTCTHITERTP